jgi:hypothetical protein
MGGRRMLSESMDRFDESREVRVSYPTDDDRSFAGAGCVATPIAESIVNPVRSSR